MKSLRNNIRKIILESLLKEGDGIFVRNLPHEEKLEGILDICHFVVSNISRKLVPELKLTPEEIEGIRGFMDDFSPDGSDAFKETGVMNFYCRNWPQRTHEKIIGFIKWILSEEDITVGEVTSEDYTDPEYTGVDHNIRVYRIPILKNENEADLPPELHLSSSTWKQLIEDVLGFESYQEDIPVDKLQRNIEIARATLQLKDMPDETEYQKQGSIYTANKGKDYMLRLMDILESLCKWCQERGYTSVYIA